MDKLVSVIVPVYKVEKYLDRCILSIVNQTYKNIELILVNDGSPDKSPEICDNWKQKDERIKVIHKQNQGVSIARNVGIDAAQGDFIIFVDSDDYLELDLLETVTQHFCDDVDVVMYGFFQKRSDDEIIENGKFANEKISLDDLKKNFWFYSDKLINSACNKLYKTNIIKQNTNYFNDEIKYAEDLIFNLNYFENCKTIKSIDYQGYNYMINENQCTKNVIENYFTQMMIAFESINNFRLDVAEFDSNIIKDIEQKQVLFNFKTGIGHLCKENKSLKHTLATAKTHFDNEYVQKMKDYKFHDKNCISKTNKVLKLLLKIKAYFCVCLAIKIRIKIKKVRKQG